MIAIRPSDLQFREATLADVPVIVAMLADDVLGSTREQAAESVPRSYLDAFTRIDIDPNQELVVVESDGVIVGTLQLTFLAYLTYEGGTRAQIEAVRVSSAHRGSGIGGRMVEWAIERARDKPCHLVQLTTDKRRPDAIRFYEDLGFESTHEGMKLHLVARG